MFQLRTFILHALKARTDGNFNLEDLPSSGGRMDLVARCISSALFISHAIRQDTEIVAVLNGPPQSPVAVRFDGASVRKIAPDERSIAIWLKKILTEGKLTNGIVAEKKSLQHLVKEMKGRPIYVLHEKGKPIEEVTIEKDPVFVFGDDSGIPLKDEKFILRYAKEKISLGNTPYLASTVVSVLHWLCDKNGI